MARAASALSPTTRKTMPGRVLTSAQRKAGPSTKPNKNSTLTSSAERTCELVLKKPSEIEGRRGALGWISGLPR
jgi:hypothetical protein